MNYKKLIHWFHFDSVRDVLHVLTVQNFVLHSAAEFLSERKSSVTFFIGKIRL